MSITDELREYAEENECKSYRNLLLAIADRIDAEHESKVSYWQGASYKDGYDEGFASADDWLAQHEDAMAEHGWVRLPKDADDVPWNPGDRDEDGNVVFELVLNSDGWYLVNGTKWVNKADSIRHYLAPTVEDVLREFAAGLGVPVADSYVAATAMKLRLAEGEDA